MDFKIENTRGVRLAVLGLTRPLTVIVGANGSGKSTVLDWIRQQTFGRHIYIGPHRATRRQHARLRFMGGGMPAMGDLMSAPSMGGFEGVTITTGVRDAWELDEAGNFFKYNLSKIEFQRSSAISQIFDRVGKVDSAEIGDVWLPLKELTSQLLPHLSFSRIEITNHDNMRCLFYVHDKAAEVDFDDLSSGEKAILQTLYPIIEPEIFKALDKINQSGYIVADKQFIIIDEPELHLHPSLQQKLVSYLRSEAIRRSIKVLLATHSPTIIDSVDDGDIYLLRPSEQVPQGENQAANLGDDPRSLITVQEAIGSIFPVTAARPLVFIEGSDRVSVRSYSDRQIYVSIDPRFLRVNLVSGNGKDECLAALASARGVLAEQPYKIGVYALLDRDLEQADSPADGAFHLPVCMVENLLLSRPALRAGFDPMLHATAFTDDDALDAALSTAVADIRADEIIRRFRKKVRMATFGPRRDVIDVNSAEAYRSDFVAQIQAVNFQALFDEANDEVVRIEHAGQQTKLFSGKLIMNKFYDTNVQPLGMSKPIFVYNAAKSASDDVSTRTFFDELFEKLV